MTFGRSIDESSTIAKLPQGDYAWTPPTAPASFTPTVVTASRSLVIRDRRNGSGITGGRGPDRGWTGGLAATIAGAATPGGPVIGFSIGAVALKVGGGTPQVIAYVISWALFAFQRLILWEIPFMPAKFVWFRAAVSLPFPFLAAALSMAIGKP